MNDEPACRHAPVLHHTALQTDTNQAQRVTEALTQPRNRPSIASLSDQPSEARDVLPVNEACAEARMHLTQRCVSEVPATSPTHLEGTSIGRHDEHSGGISLRHLAVQRVDLAASGYHVLCDDCSRIRYAQPAGTRALGQTRRCRLSF